jgi:16S rRNA processing protein RimM
MMDMLAIGKVGGSHGVGGYMKVVSLSGETGHFFKLKEVIIRSGSRQQTLAIEGVKPYKSGAVLIKFQSIDSPEEGKRLTSSEILVPREQCSPLTDGEYYIADLCQCMVNRDGVPVGTVVAVCEGSQAELLEVELEDKRRIYIPFMHQYIGDVDVAKKSIELLTGVEIW